MSNELHQSIMGADYGGGAMAETMRFVWQPFPWVVNAYTGSCSESRMQTMRAWLTETFGGEGSPIHGLDGTWHLGGATILGWTWIGFSTEQLMGRFLARWRDQTWWAAELGEACVKAGIPADDVPAVVEALVHEARDERSALEVVRDELDSWSAGDCE